MLAWLKALHLIFMVTWFAGLFYLPRLFVYHADCFDEPGRARFRVMERKLLAIMTIGMLLTLVFGIAQLVVNPGWLKAGWMHAKLLLVALLVGYHLWCWRIVKSFAADLNTRSHVWFRWFNEVPALALIGIVILAGIKPF